MIEQTHTYHTPVLLEECIDALNIKPEGVYVDATFGGGGHSRPILERMTAKGRLFGFDQDKRAQDNAIDDSRFAFVRANFKYISHFIKYYGAEGVDGVLADLGVSSHHFDEPSRGFSYRFDTMLDMRMNQHVTITAQDVLATYSQQQLQHIFSVYGELRNARTFSAAICEARKMAPISKVSQLLDLIGRVYRGDRQKYTSQVFQALRIEVNDEMGTLELFLERAVTSLLSGGRLVVISYHSLEDKVVKRILRGDDSGRAYTDDYGRRIDVVRQITRKPIVPSAEEIERNSRAASAKLRVIEKI